MNRIKKRIVGLSRKNKSRLYNNLNNFSHHGHFGSINLLLNKREKIVVQQSPILMTVSSPSECNPSSDHDSYCSHEKLKIECNISSGEFKPASTTGRQFLEREQTLKKFGSCLLKPEKAMEDDLLALDESLLENIDLSFKEASPARNTKKQCLGINRDVVIKGIHPLTIENNLLEKSKSKVCCESPDIFSNNTEYNDDQDTEDKPWDMSITVIEDKEKSVCEQPQSSLNKCPMSPGLSDVILNTWVPSPQPQSLSFERPKRLSFEGMIKNTLANNAHKVSSPKPLFSSSDDCSSSSFFGLSENVKNLIKRYKGIKSLYSKYHFK